MVSLFEGNIQKTIEKLSDSLKSVVKAPEWSLYVKTSSGKERPPFENDWFYKRTASVLITVYRRGPIGVPK